MQSFTNKTNYKHVKKLLRMKRKFLYIMSLLLTAVITVSAEKIQIEGTTTYYELIDGTMTISGEGGMKDYTAASLAPWHEDRTSITKVVIASGITHVGSYSFYQNSNLTSITLPEGLISIGHSAFRECGKIISVTFPSTFNTFGDFAFNSCGSLMEITILNKTPPSFEWNTFIGIAQMAYCNVPYSSVNTYEYESGYTSVFYVGGLGDDTLNYLTVSEGSLDPYFTSNTTNYTVSVAYSVETIEISARTNAYNATIGDGDTGTKSLTVGENIFIINVTGFNNNFSNQYKITVTREAQSNDATLSGLTVSPGGLTPSFTTSNETYTMEVDYSVKDITVNATANHTGATVTVEGAEDLEPGENTITVKVKAEDDTEKVYTITVTRKAASTDNTLSALSVSEGTLTPIFDSNTTAYTVEVEYTVENITINATTTDTKASVVGTGSKSLSIGANPFTVKVTAEDGTSEKEYTITVTRKAGSTDNTLSSIDISEGTLSPAFSSSVTDYTVNVGSSVTQITIDAITNDTKSNVTGGGTIDLDMGTNKITLTVTAEDGTPKDYIITVTRGDAGTTVHYTVTLEVAPGINLSNQQAGKLVIEDGGHLHLQFLPEDASAAAGNILFLVDGVETSFSSLAANHYYSYILNPIKQDHTILIALKKYNITLPDDLEGATISPGSGEQDVNYGDSYEFTVTLEEGTNPDDVKVYVNGREIEPESISFPTLTYVIDQVTGPVDIRIEGTGGGTVSNTGIAGDDISITIVDGELRIDNYTGKSIIASVYSVQGKQVAVRRVDNNDSISLKSGIYLVKIGDKVYKICIN